MHEMCAGALSGLRIWNYSNTARFVLLLPAIDASGNSAGGAQAATAVGSFAVARLFKPSK
jgi:hypothetical protein